MGNSRTRRAGAGLSVSAGASPAMRPVVRRPPAKRCAPLVPWPSLAPAVGNSRGCAEQVAHAPSRRRVNQSGKYVTRDAACGAAAARKAVRPVGSLAQSRTHAVCFGCGLLFPGAQTGPLFPQARGWFVFVLGSAPRPFFYSIKQAQACKAMRSLQVVQLFCLHKFYIPCSISCGVWKRTVLPQWFSTFSTEFSTTPHRVLHRVSTLNI